MEVIVRVHGHCLVPLSEERAWVLSLTSLGHRLSVRAPETMAHFESWKRFSRNNLQFPPAVIFVQQVLLTWSLRDYHGPSFLIRPTLHSEAQSMKQRQHCEVYGDSVVFSFPEQKDRLYEQWHKHSLSLLYKPYRLLSSSSPIPSSFPTPSVSHPPTIIHTSQRHVLQKFNY